MCCGLYQSSCDLEYMSLEDVVSQLHRLLPVQLALLSGEHEGQESVATPADKSTHTLINQKHCACIEHIPYLTNPLFFRLTSGHRESPCSLRLLSKPATL